MAPGERTKELRHVGKAVPLALAFVLAMGAVAFADQITGEADGDILATPHGVTSNHTQQPGTTVAYSFSAMIRETGNANDDVFPGTLPVSVVRSGDWLAAGDAGSPSALSFTGYDAANVKTGTVRVTVPCGTTSNTQKTMSATLTGGTSTNGKTLGSGGNNTVTLNYVVTASGTDHSSCVQTPTNSAPVVAADSGSVTVNEGSVASMSGTWSDANPGDTVNLSASVGSVVPDGTNASGTWSWSYTPDDGPSDGQTVTITVDDGTTSTTATFGLTVNNVAPTATLGNDGPIDEGGSATVTFSGASDPSNADTTAGFMYAFSCSNSPGSMPTTYEGAGLSSSTTCSFDDGPDNPTVLGRIFDKDNGYTDVTTTVAVNNVAPTATRNSASSVTTLSGLAVNFNFTATDPSEADTAAGFKWRLDDGKGGGYGVYGAFQTSDFSPSATYASCGAYTVTAQAMDKDGGESNEPSATINVFNGDFHGAIVPATRNLVQKGRVIPVQVRIGCGGVAQTGLSPVIMLIAGDADPNTDSSDPAVLTPTTVSAADTTGFMRPTDTGYLYNLQIPSNAVAGAKYTILVRPWGSGATMKALIEIRK